MDAQIENLIELYVTRGGRVFVSPQYDVKHEAESGEGGSCPDLVALDTEEREVVVIEVSSASNLKALFGKIDERESRWFNPIMRRLLKDEVVTPKWQIRFLGFVRRDNLESARARYAGDDKVWFYGIEEAAFSFAYWSEREKGLPRGPSAQASQSENAIVPPFTSESVLAAQATNTSAGSAR